MDDGKSLELLAVTTTVGTEADAVRLARDLVEQRLAACVQVDAGVRSVYRWEGRLCDDPEWRLTIKTVPQRAAALQEFFRQHHPYEVPQFLATSMRASAAYFAWAEAQTSQET